MLNNQILDDDTLFFFRHGVVQSALRLAVVGSGYSFRLGFATPDFTVCVVQSFFYNSTIRLHCFRLGVVQLDFAVGVALSDFTLGVVQSRFTFSVVQSNFTLDVAYSEYTIFDLWCCPVRLCS